MLVTGHQMTPLKTGLSLSYTEEHNEYSAEENNSVSIVIKLPAQKQVRRLLGGSDLSDGSGGSECVSATSTENYSADSAATAKIAAPYNKRGGQKHNENSGDDQAQKSSRENEADGEDEESDHEASSGRDENSDQSVSVCLSRKASIKGHSRTARSGSSAIKEKCDIVCTIGTGSFGRVYLVREKQSNQYRALKVMSITEMFRLKQVEHVFSEKEVLMQLSHPFVVNLCWNFADQKCLYMLFEYAAGGELFSHIKCAGCFNNTTAQFYAAEIVLVIEYLHSRNIAHRDIKPENILLDSRGHIKLTDFGFAKVINNESITWTICGTPEYMAPEVIQGKGYGKNVDWWSVGILIYEMVSGATPYRGKSALETYKNILRGNYNFKSSTNKDARDLISKLLVTDRSMRLGNIKGGAANIKSHKWFATINWDTLASQELTAPIVPVVNDESDSGNFDEYDEFDVDDFADASELQYQRFKNW